MTMTGYLTQVMKPKLTKESAKACIELCLRYNRKMKKAEWIACVEMVVGRSLTTKEKRGDLDSIIDFYYDSIEIDEDEFWHTNR